MNPMKLSILLPCLVLAACSRPEARATRSADSARSMPIAPQSAAPHDNDRAAADSPAEESAPPSPMAAAPATPSASARGAGRASAGDSYQRHEAEKKAAERDERPGLGTTWGETRSSYVSSAPFDRADGDSPFAVLALNYNDESGVLALAHRNRENGVSFERAGFNAARGALSVRLLDSSGRALESTAIGGRDYVVGADGERYVIQIENHTGGRFEAVASVDGLDVLDGLDASYAKRGYLIGPWATLEIDGFRQSQATVAAFRFGAVKDSYAARTGTDRNVGVIGVAFFQEYGSTYPWTDRELNKREDANAFPGGFAVPPRR
ncbi:MAG TPA: hypothetical protein VGM29_15255 [Polyangiaceae bacterium]